MKYLKIIASGILAGLFIGLGSFAYVACVAFMKGSGIDGLGNIIGSVLFSVGLFMVCFFSTSLYTGRIGFAPEKFKVEGPSYLLELVLMLAGNFIGSAGSGSLLYLAFLNEKDSKLVAVSAAIAQKRSVFGSPESDQAWWKALIMGVFCGMLVFLAVYIWKKAEHPFLKATGLILCVTTFVVTGTEHCIANMFYYAFGWQWNLGDFFDVLLVIVGNSLGSLALYYLFGLAEKVLAKKTPQA
jgi:formate/nitrite transporter FocA (FNT family)